MQKALIRKDAKCSKAICSKAYNSKAEWRLKDWTLLRILCVPAAALGCTGGMGRSPGI